MLYAKDFGISFTYFKVDEYHKYFFNYFIVVQLQLSAFSPHHSPAPQPNLSRILWKKVKHNGIDFKRGICFNNVGIIYNFLNIFIVVQVQFSALCPQTFPPAQPSPPPSPVSNPLVIISNNEDQ